MEKPAEDIALLISKYLLHELTEAEQAELEDWTGQSPEHLRYFLTLTRDREALRTQLQEFEQDHHRVWQLISQSIDGAKKPSGLRKLWRIPAAAAILAAAALTTWLLLPHTPQDPDKQHTQDSTKDITPGDNKAVLTLANGQQIQLDNAKNGLLATEGNAAISLMDSVITYQVRQGAPTAAVLYNRITTPRGGQFALILPDGSRAWLNAASSIRFPTAFNAEERKVSITGEVYLEVAQVPLPKSRHGGKMPFIVEIQRSNGVPNGIVEVLGTAFNINAYDEENAIKTTLVKGSVKVSASGTSTGTPPALILAPGQQAQITGNTSPQLSLVAHPDMEAITGWKDGFIHFGEDITTIMRKLSRWYDIEVEFRGPITSTKYFGQVSRNEDIHMVLRLLEMTGGVHFIIEGRKIIVTS